MIRVLRVIEYVYQDLDTFDRDKGYWKSSFVNPPDSRHISMTSEVVRVQEIKDEK